MSDQVKQYLAHVRDQGAHEGAFQKAHEQGHVDGHAHAVVAHARELGFDLTHDELVDFITNQQRDRAEGQPGPGDATA